MAAQALLPCLSCISVTPETRRLLARCHLGRRCGGRSSSAISAVIHYCGINVPIEIHVVDVVSVDVDLVDIIYICISVVANVPVDVVVVDIAAYVVVMRHVVVIDVPVNNRCVVMHGGIARIDVIAVVPMNDRC